VNITHRNKSIRSTNEKGIHLAVETVMNNGTEDLRCDRDRYSKMKLREFLLTRALQTMSVIMIHRAQSMDQAANQQADDNGRVGRTSLRSDTAIRPSSSCDWSSQEH
jgi:hypothetical protein